MVEVEALAGGVGEGTGEAEEVGSCVEAPEGLAVAEGSGEALKSADADCEGEARAERLVVEDGETEAVGEHEAEITLPDRSMP